MVVTTTDGMMKETVDTDPKDIWEITDHLIAAIGTVTGSMKGTEDITIVTEIGGIKQKMKFLPGLEMTVLNVGVIWIVCKWGIEVKVQRIISALKNVFVK